MRRGHDQMVEERRADSAVTHWTRRGGGIPSGIPPGHMATPEWLWRSDVDPGRTDALRRRMEGWGEGPPPQHQSGLSMKS